MAVKVSITKDLEARLRAGGDPGPLLEEVIALIDAAIGAGGKKKEARTESGTGMGFKELLSWFHFYLGPDFAPPIKPDPSYVVRMVNLAKLKGVTKENVGQICEGARRAKPGPYGLGAVLWRAEEYFKCGGEFISGDSGVQDSGGPEVLGETKALDGHRHGGQNVRTGRERVDDNSGDI